MMCLSCYRLPGLIASFLLLTLAAQGQPPAWRMAMAIASPVGSSAQINATAADVYGNVYVAGNFRGTATFGTISLTNSSSAANQADVFVAKWHPAVGWAWVRQGSGSSDDEATALVVSGNSVYVTGSYGRGMGPSSITFGSTTLTNAGNQANVFVAKLTDDGPISTWTWAEQAGDINVLEKATAIAVSGTSVYVAGHFLGGTATFGSTVLTNASNQNDVFVAKLTDAGSTGAWTWAQRAGGSSGDLATGLAASGTNVYVAGRFRSAMAHFGAMVLTNAGLLHDVFVARLTDNGPTSTWTWAQQAGGSDDDGAQALAVNGNSLYVAGNFGGPTAAFGSLTLTNTGGTAQVCTGCPVWDTFVAKLTDTGSTATWVWAQQAGGTDIDGETLALAVSGTGVYVAGTFFSNSIAFGTTSLPNTYPRTSAISVARLTDGGTAGTWDWAQQAEGNDDDFAAALAVSGNRVYVAGYFNSWSVTFGAISLPGNADPSFTYNGYLASLTDPLLSAPEELTGRAFRLAPNPAHDIVRVVGATGPTITLFDGLGRPVRAVPQTEGAAALDVRGLAPGLYLVRAGGQTRRLVVE